MNEYLFSLTENEMAFFRQLFDSQVSVTIATVEIVAELKKKILTAKPRSKDAAPQVLE